MGIRYFVYARKSTDDEHRQLRSIGDQLAELEELAGRERLVIVDRFVEHQSAKTAGRPVFNEMLRRIEKGEANAILAWAPDRISRNMTDADQVIQLVEAGNIKLIRFPSHRIEPNAQGVFSLMMAFTQSKFYVDNLSENICRGRNRKIRDGVWPQIAPLGYVNNPKTRGIDVHPVNGPIIRVLFEKYSQGTYSLKQLRDTAIAMGFELPPRNGWHRESRVQKMLENPFYCGMMLYKGELYEGKHEPLVSRATFDTCQRVMKRRGHPTFQPVPGFLFSRLIRCDECGYFITAEKHKGRHYMRCTKKGNSVEASRRCQQPFARQDRVAEQAREMVNRMALSDEVAERLLNKAEQLRVKDLDAAKAEQEAIRGEIRKCECRIERLRIAYIDDVMGLEEYRETKNTLVLEREAQSVKLEKLVVHGAIWVEPFRTFITACQEAASVANGGDSASVANFIRNHGLNLTLRERRLKWDLRGVSQLVETEDFVALQRLGRAGPVLNEEQKKEQEEREWSRGELNPPTLANLHEKTGDSVSAGDSGGAKCGAPGAGKSENRPPDDPELDAIVRAWPTLAPALKAAMLALVGANKSTGGAA